MNQEQVRDWLKENWFKAGVLVVLLVVAYSFYHVLVVRPDIEREEAAEAQGLAEIVRSNKKAAAQKDLNSCISNAGTSYSENWFRECKSSGRLSNKCIDIQELTFEEYLEKYGLTEEGYRAQRDITDTNAFAGLLDYLGRRDDECSCRLPLANADRLNEDLKESKETCYKLHPLD